MTHIYETCLIFSILGTARHELLRIPGTFISYPRHLLITLYNSDFTA